jgi:hypothetical protein
MFQSTLLNKLLNTSNKKYILNLLRQNKTEGEILKNIQEVFFIKKAKTDFKSFVFLFYTEVSAGNNFESSPHTDILIKICQLKANREIIQDVNIVIPPGHTKTTICNVLFTAFILGLYPNLRIIFGCNSIDEGLKRNQDVINIMTNPLYQKIFPDTILTSKTKTWFQTNSGGGRRAVSTDIATRFTGGDADLLLIDDANDTTGTQNDFDKVQDWFYKKAERRLRRTKFDLGVLNIQQLTGEGCLANILLKRKKTFTLTLKAFEENDVKIEIPIAENLIYTIIRKKGFLWEKKENEYLTIKEEKPFIWDTQYQANPLAKKGDLFSIKNIQDANDHDLNGKYTIEEIREMMSEIILAIDPAVTDSEKSDKTGLVVIGFNGVNYFVLEDRSGHYHPQVWAGEVLFLYKKWRFNHLIAEKNQGGQMIDTNIRSYFQLQNYIVRFPITLVPATFGKRLRAEPVATMYQQNKVKHIQYFKNEEVKNNLDDLEYEMLTFTGNIKDKSPDRLDALVHGLTYFIVEEPELSHKEVFGDVFGEENNLDY